MKDYTTEKLRNNPHYKPSPGQLGSDPEEEETKEEPFKTFGIPPKIITTIPKKVSQPKKRTHKKPIDN